MTPSRKAIVILPFPPDNKPKLLLIKLIKLLIKLIKLLIKLIKLLIKLIKLLIKLIKLPLIEIYYS